MCAILMLKVPANLVDQKEMIVDSVSRIGNMNDLRQGPTLVT